MIRGSVRLHAPPVPGHGYSTECLNRGKGKTMHDDLAKMPVEIARAWANALRSGNYIQGKGRLRADFLHDDGTIETRWCCLGVLCDLWAAATGHQPRRHEYAEYDRDEAMAQWTYGSGGEASNSYPPPAVQRWAGLTADNPNLRGRGEASKLNDGIDAETPTLPFAEIADLIDPDKESKESLA